MKTENRKYGMLFLLALVFALPGIVAFWVYKHPEFIGAASINKGTLINPPEKLAFPSSKSTWRLLLWNPGNCEKTCIQKLDKLGRIRLALGRRLYDVEEWLLTEEAQSELTPSLLSAMKEMDIKHLSVSQKELQEHKSLTDMHQIFIVNPDGYLILSYAWKTKPQNIFHDLYHLLTSNEQINR